MTTTVLEGLGYVKYLHRNDGYDTVTVTDPCLSGISLSEITTGNQAGYKAA